MRDGLSNSNVQCIMQDSYGFMWFGTENGLNRFDGYELKTYYYSDDASNNLPSSNVQSLCLDSKENLWIGTTKGLCQYDPAKDNFKTFLSEDSTSLGKFNIIYISEDAKGILWLAAYREGIIKFNPHDEHIERLTHIPDISGSLSSNLIFSLFHDSRGKMWVSTLDKGLNLYHPATNSFSYFQHDPQNPRSLLGNDIHTLTEDTEGRIWIACNYKGLSSIHLDELSEGVFKNYIHTTLDNSISSSHVRIVCSDSKGGIWIGYENGLVDYVIEGVFQQYDLSNGKVEIPGEDAVNVMYLDKNENLWIGNSYTGVQFIHPLSEAIKTYRSNSLKKSSLSHNKVWEFAEDKDGYIWIATDGGGLNRFDPELENFTSYTTQNSNIGSNDILSVFVDSANDIWLGTWEAGIFRFNLNKNEFLNFNTENSALSNNNVFDITEDTRGNIWIATQNGLNKLNKSSQKIESYTPENSQLLFHQMEVVKVDLFGNILIGNVQGLVIFNPDNKKFKTYRHNPKSLISLSDNFVTSIFEQDSNTLWIATHFGLNKLERKTETVRHYFMKDGLSSDIIYGIERDNEGDLWISTDRGIVRFDERDNVFDSYGIDDGLQDYKFIKKSHLRTKDGTLYFGGINGFNRIAPEKFKSEKSTFQIVFTELLVSNKSVYPNDETGILSKQLFLTDSITLTHNYPNFTVKFAALEYKNTDNIQYAYKLEGYDEDWSSFVSQGMATYTNLDPGKYILKARCHSQSDAYEGNSIKLFIKVQPPWWKTLYFKIFVLIILSALIFALYRIRVNQLKNQKLELEKQVKLRTNELIQSNRELVREQQKLTEANILLEENHHEMLSQNEEIEKHRTQLETLVWERTSELEKAKEKAEESDRLKSSFLANLSHEIRTPMNAIVGFASLLDSPDLSDDERRKYISMVNGNCDSLTILINDIIDISLIQSDQIKLVKSPFHVDMIFEELLAYYNSFNNKNIDFIFENKDREKELTLENDPGRFKQILTNLLSNAYKYTEKGSVRFGYKIGANEIRFYVADTGIGIKESDFKTIFNHFHKLDSSNQKLYRGVGIGLSICKKLVQMMGGTIGLESTPEVGSTFYFTLPLQKQLNPLKPATPDNVENIDLQGYTILIAEDDATNYMLLEKLMKPTNAKILWAKNGIETTEAVQKITNPKKLIVLMDIKMPLMNGVEALRIIRKKHKELPIIAVTAYAQEKDRLEILKNNFDGYITKPILRKLLIKAIRDAIAREE